MVTDTKSEAPAQDSVRDTTVHMASPEHIGYHSLPLQRSHLSFHSDRPQLPYLHDERRPGQFHHEPMDSESHFEPLDLSVPRPPRGDSAESISSSPSGGVGSKDQNGRRLQRPALVGRGVSCSSSSVIPARSQRPSPYPQLVYSSSLPPRSGYSSPAASELQAQSHYYQPSQQMPLSSSPVLFHHRSSPFYMEGNPPYGARVGLDMTTSSAPSLLSPYAEGSLHAHGPLGLLTTSHQFASVLSTSSRDRDLSSPSSNHVSSRSRDLSPRQGNFFRPFDDVHRGTTHTPVTTPTTVGMGAEPTQRTSEADLSASSSLLMLSTRQSPTSCAASQQEALEHAEGDRHHQMSPYHASARESCLNTSFEACNSNPSAFRQLPSHQQTPQPRPSSSAEQPQQGLSQYMGTPSRKSSSPVYENGSSVDRSDEGGLRNKGFDTVEASVPTSQLPSVLNGQVSPSHKSSSPVYENGSSVDRSDKGCLRNKGFGILEASVPASRLPTFLNCPVSQSSDETSLAKACSPPSPQKPESSKPQKPLSSRFVTVLPSFSLSHEIITKSERDARRDGLFHFLNKNGIEVGGERNSNSETPMEKPDEESAIKPPDPNLKMSPLDYIISKVLVERLDVPFKACNTEIKKIYLGERKGKLRLADLIELQVEESLKA